MIAITALAPAALAGACIALAVPAHADPGNPLDPNCQNYSRTVSGFPADLQPVRICVTHR
jgi:hypothetical protein